MPNQAMVIEGSESCLMVFVNGFAILHNGIIAYMSIHLT